ncbi:MAG: NADP-dependent malic enzyme [Conexivisphaerales archaeon]
MGEKQDVNKPYELAVKYAKYYGGKVEVVPRVPVTSLKDFGVWYTPGVAQVSKEIFKDKGLSFEYTNRWNTIAILTNGTRVLGLGDIGPEASAPVMEGKALIFKYLGGVDAFALPIRVPDKERFVDVAKVLEPALGGINLEDIRQPDCFYILERCRREMNIPVWHDDQQGTAAATVAGLINAVKVVGRKMADVSVVFLGAGAANISNARLAMTAGVDPKKIILVDSKGILQPEREDIDKIALQNPWKYEITLKTNGDKKKGGISDALKGANVLIAAATPGPDVVKTEWIKSMEKDSIVFAMANPVPEIWPWEAKNAGAKIVATGRSDFPNQVNNSLVFPSLFRGVLDIRAKTITDEMAVAASIELAEFAEEGGLSEERIVPKMTEWEVYPRVATAVAMKAMEQGITRKKMTRNELMETATVMISHARNQIDVLMRNGVIPPFPE